MLPPIRASIAKILSVEEVAARLSRQREVDGVVMMGSGGAGQLSSASDIDLLVVLSGVTLARLRMISTNIGGRLAEVYFTPAGALDRWLSERKPLPQESLEAVMLRWIESGQVLFDRAGRLARLQDALRGGVWSSPPDEAEIYAAWFRTNYDLAQTQRLVTADDEVSWIKADLRLPRMLAELWERYFMIRRLPGFSEKGRIRWMQVNDADFLAAMLACLREVERRQKFTQYIDLAQKALEPAGGLWPDASTAAELEGGDPVEAETALETWEAWLSDE